MLTERELILQRVAADQAKAAYEMPKIVHSDVYEYARTSELYIKCLENEVNTLRKIYEAAHGLFDQQASEFDDYAYDVLKPAVDEYEGTQNESHT